MNHEKNYLFPTELLSREIKEKHLDQHSKVIWFTGLSGAGKTTLGQRLEIELFKKGYLCQLLDGDNVRSGINRNLGFSDDDRVENIRRVAEVSKLFLHCGITTINCFIAPTHQIREMVAEIVGPENLIDVFIDAPLSICEERDTKGLYRLARAGKIQQFTGINSVFEPPLNPTLSLQTDIFTIEQCVQKLLDTVLPLIKY
jgi:adenylylsulfate kinase